MSYTDYVKNTAGSQGGQMLVRVAGNSGTAGVIGDKQVQFFVRSGLTQTTVGSPGFGTSVYYNGAWHALSNVANYSNSTDWRHVGTITVTTNQTITFHINASGTSGFGGPDDFPVGVTRATVPAEPNVTGADTITHTTFRYRFTAGSNGGSAILEHQIGYGYSSTTPTWTAASNGTITVGTFSPGSVVYIWARSRNAVGWSDWSSRTTVQMKRGLRVRSGGTWKYAIPYVRVLGVWKPFEPYVRVSGIWKLAGAT